MSIVILAALVRFGPIASGLPYISYVDEGHILHPASEILKAKHFDSGLYTYPPLTSYLVIAAIKAYSPFYRLFHHHSLRDDLPSDRDFHTELGDNYDLITPPEIIWLGRFVVACLSVGTVIATGALGRLLGGSRAGWLAMLFAALCPALVSRGSIILLDTTAAFFVIATLYCCERMRIADGANHATRWRWAMCAGIAAGCAFGGKFTAGAVFLAVLATLVVLPLPAKSKAILIAFSSAGLFAGIFCSVPGAILHPSRIAGEISGIAKFYQTIHSEAGYWSASLSNDELGYPLVLSALTGILWMLCRPTTRPVALSWIAFALLFLAAIVSSSFQPFRNILPLVPLLCIAAALAFEWLGQQVIHQERAGAASWILPALILIVASSLGWSTMRHLAARTSHIDSRVKAIDWLRQHATSNDRILGIRELAILPAEWNRVAARRTIVSWFDAAQLLEREQFDYVVTGEFDLRHAPDPGRWTAYYDHWRQQTASLAVQADFGAIATPAVPYFWRTNDERILILRGRPQF
jgi:hypothetical protein